jgi:hypothetical protein
LPFGVPIVGTLNHGLYKKEPKTGKSTEVYNTAGVQKIFTQLTPVAAFQC